MNIAVVDVDNTLVEFAEPLREELIRFTGGDIPKCAEWSSWDFHKKLGISTVDFYTCVNAVHDRIMEQEPIEDILDLVWELYADCFVVIASHRKMTNYPMLVKWLHKHEIPFDTVYMGTDKTQLYARGVGVVIDDAQPYLEAAITYGVPEIIGIQQPWNKHMWDIKRVEWW